MNLLILSSLLNLENNYKDFFHSMQTVYKKMKNARFSGTDYLTLSSYTMVKKVSIDKWDEKIERMSSFYSNMKKNHFWLTSQDDYVLAAVLATSDLEVEKTSYEMEYYYKLLNNNGFFKGTSLQSLSQILVFGEEDAERKCSRALSLYDKLNNKKCKLKYDGLASLGMLTLITSNEDEIVGEIKEVYDYIRKKQGYGFLNIEKSHVTMLAISLVADCHIDKIKEGLLDATLANSINAILIAEQQVIMSGCIVASVAAASSSSN